MYNRKSASKTARSKSLITLILVSMLCASTSAQIAPEVMSRTTIATKPAIPFQPFAADRNPFTGEKVDPNQRIQLEDGKSGTVQEIISELNQHERWLNQRGYTLRTKQLTNKSLPLNDTPIIEGFTKPDLGSQPSSNFPAYRPISRSADIFHRDFKIGFAEAEAYDKFLSANPVLMPKSSSVPTVTDSKYFTFGLGKKEYLKGMVSGTLTLQTSQQLQTLKLVSVASGAIFGKEKDILRINGIVTNPANQSKPMVATIEFYSGGGDKLYTYHKSEPNGFTYTQSPNIASIKIIPTIEGVFPLGPVPIRYKAGVTASINADLTVALRRGYIQGSIKPYIKGDVWAEAWVDLLVVKAGTSASLTIVQAGLNFEVDQGVRIDQKWKKPLAYRRLAATAEVGFLGGNWKIWVKTRKVFGFSATLYKHTIWSREPSLSKYLLWSEEKKTFFHDIK